MDTPGFSAAQVHEWLQGMIMQNGTAPNARITDIVNSSERLSAARHLHIYQGSYIARLRACMAIQFSALAYALGEDLFRDFADYYLSTHPSQSYTLNDLGEKFSAFLAATRPDADDEIKETWPDFMIELADFEYAILLIFDAFVTDNLQPATEDMPDEQLLISPLLQLFNHKFPVCQYYLDFSQKKSPELPFPEESYCAVVRHNYKMGLFTLKPAQYYFLGKLQQGGTVSDAINEMAQRFELEDAFAANIWKEMKSNYIGSGFFVGDGSPR